MSCKYCHESMPPKPKDEFCSEICREEYSKLNPTGKKMKENIIDQIVFDVSKNRAKILDDFAKAYLAGRWEDYFSKQNKIDLRRLELVEDRSELPDKITYHFRLKKGKLRSN